MKYILYAYEKRITQAPSIDECGTFQEVYAEEQPPHFQNQYYEEFYTLLGVIQVVSYMSEGEWVITIAALAGEEHTAGQLFFLKAATFTPEEAAALLDLTLPELLIIIQEGKLPVKHYENEHSGNAYRTGQFICGMDILTLSLARRNAQ
jgi:hypothetical protein